jgi:hypothetical protein
MAEIKTTRGSAMPIPGKSSEAPDLSVALAAANKMIKNPPPARKVGPFQVIATQAGWYGNTRKKEGDIFTCVDRKHFSAMWMKEI